MHVTNVRFSVCFITFIENINRVRKPSKFQPDLKCIEKPTREAKFERNSLSPRSSRLCTHSVPASFGHVRRNFTGAGAELLARVSASFSSQPRI